MKFLIEEHDDMNNQYISIVGTELQVLNKWLDEHGFEIELIDNYNFGNSKAVGMFLRTEQDDASVFPVALNKDALINGSNELSYDDYSLKNELTYAIRGTLWHEAGHGIFDFLSDIYYLDDLDEEDIVEEFAEYGEDSELFNILVQYEKDSLNEHLLIEMPEKVDKMKLSQEQDRRRKLTDEQKEEIRKLYSTGMHSLNSLAREYGVSKKTILLIVNPDSKAKSDARIKAHWQDYYDREEHNKAIKNLRNYKKDLLKKGELKENKNSSLENKLINKLKSQGYTYEYKPIGWYDDKDNPIDVEDHIDEYGNFEVPNDYFYRENNSHIFLGDNVDIIWDIDEQEKEFKILSIWSYKGAKKGEASQMLYSCLEEIPKNWTIVVKDNINRNYWAHMRDKFPEYEWVNESLNKQLKEDLDQQELSNEYDSEGNQLTKAQTNLTPNDIENVLKDNFVTSNSVILRSWLAPSGLFISNINYSDEDDEYLGEPNHSVVLEWLADKGYIKDDSYSELEKLGFIRLSNWDSAIILTDTSPTVSQYSQIREWMDEMMIDTSRIFVDVPSGESKWFYFEDYTSGDIVNRIKRYYSSGNLYENLQEDIGYRTETTYGSGIRDLREILDFEIIELGNVDIPATIVKNFPMKNNFEKMLLNHFVEEPERYSRKQKYDIIKLCQSIILRKYPKAKYAIWLADKDVVKSYYGGTEEDIDGYETEYDIPISDLGREGKLYLYSEMPQKLNKEK